MQQRYLIQIGLSLLRLRSKPVVGESSSISLPKIEQQLWQTQEDRMTLWSFTDYGNMNPINR